MYEVEVKVPADHDEVRAALADTDATESDTVHQSDTYYNAPHRDFEATDEALRIRRVRFEDDTERTEAARVTYKGPKVDTKSKTRREIEVGVGDGDDMGAILEALDFDPAATVNKTRTHFDFKGYTVTLDTVEGVGEFVEVERESGDVESAREGAFDVLRDLGLDPESQVTTSYLGLLLE
ncbi:class IV adenylate cyclase [Halocalculus aciditolerans]|uniref:Adenylate cyclase n=1 Tax=Halocalculus aciditolerans TaxID=1383812 RepID=A0A830FGM1_9EURY|nr:class IV adenylate cyclase [Halocalculus aciditolerans]GGL53803.1 adenylate cyclase [Halocalculus aciditolerans]